MKLNPNVKGTVAGVQDIIDTDVGTGAIHRFLNIAYHRTLPIASELSNCGGTAALAEIQNFYAAHLISVGRERQTKSESVAGEASVTFAGDAGGAGLRSTSFGQMAIDLDCSGILARSGLKRATFRVWDHDDIDYDVETEDLE
jgi:hypothetical protein